jgi:hypothetical protein
MGTENVSISIGSASGRFLKFVHFPPLGVDLFFILGMVLPPSCLFSLKAGHIETSSEMAANGKFFLGMVGSAGQRTMGEERGINQR